VKIVREEKLIGCGEFAASPDWVRARKKLHTAIKAVEWPPKSGKFTIYAESGKKRGVGNGVKCVSSRQQNHSSTRSPTPRRLNFNSEWFVGIGVNECGIHTGNLWLTAKVRQLLNFAKQVPTDLSHPGSMVKYRPTEPRTVGLRTLSVA
jgi:hypothetical protein